MSVVKVNSSRKLPKGRFGFFQERRIFSIFTYDVLHFYFGEVLKLGNASLAWGKTSAWVATSIFTIANFIFLLPPQFD